MNRLPTPELGDHTLGIVSSFCACGTPLARACSSRTVALPLGPCCCRSNKSAAIAGLSRSTDPYRTGSQIGTVPPARCESTAPLWSAGDCPMILNWEANPEADEYNPEGWES